MGMDRSASAPSAIRLSDEDYRVPCHGIGLTGPEKKIQLGKFSKDKGEFSSRMGQIFRDAKKTHGPAYPPKHGHTEWVSPQKVSGTRTIHETVTRFGAKFETSSRDFKPLNKVPAPNHYERKDVGTERPNDCREIQSKFPRTKFGKCSKGPKRSFLDSIAELSATLPAPGQYFKEPSSQVLRNKLEVHAGSPSFEKKHTESRKPPAGPGIAPSKYEPQWTHSEERFPSWGFPKAKGNNFVDKAVRGKMLDKKTPLPSPGMHDKAGKPIPDTNLSLTSRGTKQLQLGGFGRGAASGYF